MFLSLNGSGLKPRNFLFFLLIFLAAPVIYAQEESVEFILNEAAQRLERREFASALELFGRLKPEDAENTAILLMRASILNAAGRQAEARQIANSVLAKETDNTDALMIIADAAARDGRDRDRRTTLERVIRINPTHARALNDLGNISLGNRNLRVAASYFDRVLSVEPNNGEALVGRATVHRFSREPRRAELLLDRAVSVYPQWARPLQERARLYKSAGFLNDALEDLDAALKLEPDNYWISVDRGLVLMDMNRKQDALVEFNRAVEIDPNAFMAYVYTAGIKDELGDYEGAERDYARLGRLRPEYYFAFEGLGLLKMKNKQWAQARDAFLEAYKQAPREYNYALLAAVNWMRAGRQTDPKQFLAQVLRTAPRDSIEYSMLRLYHDLSGDSDVAVKVENEKNTYKKAQMLFYLATFYDIRGNTNLANRYYLAMQDLNAMGLVEWRLNEWILEERKLGVRAGE
jgi:tetratricopeptide (TPR) repeat protein